jgi:lipopolysaccharide biosynthesis glycosyltransferase
VVSALRAAGGHAACVNAVNSNVVYFVADRNFLPLALANAGVLARQAPRDFDVVIFYEDGAPIPFPVPPGMEIIAQTLMHAVPDAAKGNAIFRKVNWAHLYAPFVLRGRYSRGLYCDADTSICGPIGRLFELDLGGALFAGTTDPLLYLPGRHFGHAAAIGVTNGRYANSGVLLIDIESWCGNDISALLVSYCGRYEATFVDQDFINGAFQDRWLEVSPRWNFLSILIAFGFDRMISPAIYHYVSPARPWNEDAPPFAAFHRRYFEDAMAAAGIPASFLDRFGRRLPLGRKLELAVTNRLHNMPGFLQRKRALYEAWAQQYRALYAYLETGLAEARFADVSQGLCTIDFSTARREPPTMHQTIYRHGRIVDPSLLNQSTLNQSFLDQRAG